MKLDRVGVFFRCHGPPSDALLAVYSARERDSLQFSLILIYLRL